MTGILPGMEAHAGRDLALGQWDTHPELARAFVRWCGIQGQRVFEPSCGIGNIALAAKNVGGARSVVCVEIDPTRAALAKERDASLSVIISDIFAPELDDVLAHRFDPRLGGEEAQTSIGNPIFENNGALRHAKRWLDFAPRACFIAPLETLAGERDGLWDQLFATRVGVCAPGRPPFGLGGHGMSEIAFFEVVPATVETAELVTYMRRVNWRELGKP